MTDPRRPIRVLVVDDEPTICRALTIAFQRGGYDVKAIETGEGAISLIRNGEHFDCLVIDLRLKDMRGDVLFDLASAHRPHFKTATILTTGDASDPAKELLDACHCPILPKPFDLNDLFGLVKKVTEAADDVRA